MEGGGLGAVARHGVDVRSDWYEKENSVQVAKGHGLVEEILAFFVHLEKCNRSDDVAEESGNAEFLAKKAGVERKVAAAVVVDGEDSLLDQWF